MSAFVLSNSGNIRHSPPATSNPIKHRPFTAIKRLFLGGTRAAVWAARERIPFDTSYSRKRNGDAGFGIHLICRALPREPRAPHGRAWSWHPEFVNSTG